MALFVQFLLRLTFGLAAGMAITSPKQVTSGYYRNHLYVTLGLSALAALLSRSAAPEAFWYCVAAAILSYVGAVCWLYEVPTPGITVLTLLAATACGGMLQPHSTASDSTAGAIGVKLVAEDAAELRDEPIGLSSPEPKTDSTAEHPWGRFGDLLTVSAPITSGLLLGTTMAAMLLGHWYLNSPTMELEPLYRLLKAMIVAVALQTIVSALGLWGEWTYLDSVTTQWLLFVLLRWVFGLLGVAVLIFMTWQTLKVPNTQSATGILYVAVIGTFVGETMSLLLSAESLFPL